MGHANSLKKLLRNLNCYSTVRVENLINRQCIFNVIDGSIEIPECSRGRGVFQLTQEHSAAESFSDGDHGDADEDALLKWICIFPLNIALNCVDLLSTIIGLKTRSG